MGTLRYFCVLWYREHLAPQKTADGTKKRKLNKIVELKDPDPSLTLSSIHGDRFGPVSKIIGLASSANKVEGPTLKELMKIRLIKRQNPVYESFDEFIAVRTSCHLVEEVDCEFLCDCRFGVRGKICCHSMALVYDRKKEFTIDPRLNPLRFKRKRPVGRPKKLGLALTMEQPLMPGGLEVLGGPQGRVGQVAGEGSGDAHTGGAQRTGRGCVVIMEGHPWQRW